MVAAANAAAPPARSAAAAAAASDAGVMALLELVPKRRGKPSGMKHCQTMAELAAATGQCGCRTSKAAADPPQSCPYYDREGGPTRLLSFHEAPAVLRFNTYIRSGYRAGMGYRDCCRSVLQLHNETGAGRAGYVSARRRGRCCLCLSVPQRRAHLLSIPSASPARQATSGSTWRRCCCCSRSGWAARSRRGRARGWPTP